MVSILRFLIETIDQLRMAKYWWLRRDYSLRLVIRVPAITKTENDGRFRLWIDSGSAIEAKHGAQRAIFINQPSLRVMNLITDLDAHRSPFELSKLEKNLCVCMAENNDAGRPTRWITRPASSILNRKYISPAWCLKLSNGNSRRNSSAETAALQHVKINCFRMDVLENSPPFDNSPICCLL